MTRAPDGGVAVLLVDDDETARRVAVHNLRRAGLEVDDAADGAQALAAFDPARHAVVVTDLKMPEVDGMAVLATVQKRAPDTPVVVVTAFGDVDTAVGAMRAGAWDFVEKPFSRDRLELTVRRALEAWRLRRDNRRLRAQADPVPVAASPAMRQVLELAERLAGSSASVLITGESGVGKEVVARRVHAASPRARGPFVAVNCGAIPAELMESELFGHTRGAFSGAVQARQGRFRAADGGTLFLDEVGELPAALQTRLLRVLQEGLVDVVGSDQPVRVDVRVLAATNQDVERLVAEGRLREDLYYRLNVLRLHVPPLRQRPEDIEALARHFLAGADRVLALPPAVLRALQARPWRGNVRELRNVCERLALLAPGDAVRLEDLPTERIPHSDSRWLDAIPPDLSLIDVERAVVEHVLRRHRWNVSGAARALGVPRHVLAYRIEKFGISRPEDG
ncbi:sigma-54 dependent transcriptional regulator [Myxococcota bacterium]|nr:sigma-54 dependent transcriptional regulator [Myxococcota bacterium]